VQRPAVADIEALLRAHTAGGVETIIVVVVCLAIEPIQASLVEPT
jgi:hypothetical protein